MMNTQLTLHTLLERAEKYFPKKEVISRTRTGINRFSYAEMGKRTRSLSSALDKLGAHQGDKVGTLAWSDHRHLEAYFAIPSMGAVLHTMNIRLNKEHLIHIINNAEDNVLMIEEGIIPDVHAIKNDITSVESSVM